MGFDSSDVHLEVSICNLEQALKTTLLPSYLHEQESSNHLRSLYSRLTVD